MILVLCFYISIGGWEPMVASNQQPNIFKLLTKGNSMQVYVRRCHTGNLTQKLLKTDIRATCVLMKGKRTCFFFRPFCGKII